MAYFDPSPKPLILPPLITTLFVEILATPKKEMYKNKLIIYIRKALAYFGSSCSRLPFGLPKPSCVDCVDEVTMADITHAKGGKETFESFTFNRDFNPQATQDAFNPDALPTGSLARLLTVLDFYINYIYGTHVFQRWSAMEDEKSLYILHEMTVKDILDVRESVKKFMTANHENFNKPVPFSEEYIFGNVNKNFNEPVSSSEKYISGNVKEKFKQYDPKRNLFPIIDFMRGDEYAPTGKYYNHVMKDAKEVCQFVESLHEYAPPDKPDMVKKNLCTMVHVFGTNSWREIPQVPSYPIYGKAVFAIGCLHWLASYTDIKTDDGGRPVIWFDVEKEEFGLIDHPKRMCDKDSCRYQVVDLNGEVGYVCNRTMEVWLLNHKKEWVPHCRFKEEIVPDGLFVDVIGCWNKDGDILIRSIRGNPLYAFYVYNLKSGVLHKTNLVGSVGCPGSKVNVFVPD
nr:hypothetical protein [Tanacetum cinerariifolium]